MPVEITNQVRIQQYEDFWYTVEDTHLDVGCDGCTISYWMVAPFLIGYMMLRKVINEYNTFV